MLNKFKFSHSNTALIFRPPDIYTTKTVAEYATAVQFEFIPYRIKNNISL